MWDENNPPTDPNDLRRFKAAMRARARRSDTEFRSRELARAREIRQLDLDRLRERDRARARRQRSQLTEKERLEISESRQGYFESRRLDEYRTWAAMFGDICWICKVRGSSEDLEREHCHTTGLPRGLAHKACNIKLKPLEKRFYVLPPMDEFKLIVAWADESLYSALKSCIELRRSHGFTEPTQAHVKPPVLSTTPPERKFSRPPRKERQCSKCNGFGHTHLTCKNRPPS